MLLYGKFMLLYQYKISQHAMNVKHENKKIQWLTSTIKLQMSIFTMVVVEKFLRACEKQQLGTVQEKHYKKLISCRLNVNNLMAHKLTLVFNMFKHALNLVERQHRITDYSIAFSLHFLTFCIFAYFFDFLHRLFTDQFCKIAPGTSSTLS